MSSDYRLNIKEYSRIKGSDRIQINNVLVAVCVSSLTLILGLGLKQINEISIIQLSLAVPCLVSSSLAYAKICYRQENEIPTWEFLAWIFHTIGYLMIINATGLILYTNDYILASALFINFTTALFILFSIVDAYLKRKRSKEKIWKLVVYILIIFLGFVLPIIS